MFKKSTEDFKKISIRLLLFQDLVYISEYQQNNTIRIYYNKSLKDYYKVYKTIKAISQLYYFSHM